MKAERRHELKENDLSHAISVARRYVEDNGKQVTIGVIVVVAVIAAVGFGVRSRTAGIEDVWRRKAQLSFDDPQVGRDSLAALAAMRDDVADERFALASLVEQGQYALRLAQQVPDPPDRELNDQARKAFDELLRRFPENPLALGIAHSGLATVEENEFVIDGDLAHKEWAGEHLAAIIKEPALNGMPFQRIARDRRKALDETFTVVEFDYPEPEDAPEPTAESGNNADDPTGDSGSNETTSNDADQPDPPPTETP
jgi:hypothetical protein